MKGGVLWEPAGNLDGLVPKRWSDEIRFASIALGVSQWLVVTEIFRPDWRRCAPRWPKRSPQSGRRHSGERLPARRLESN